MTAPRRALRWGVPRARTWGLALSVAWLLVAGLAGLGAPLLGPGLTGFDEVEQHLELRLRPPGTLGLPDAAPPDGDGSHFGRLDRDGNGAITGAEELLELEWLARFARDASTDLDKDRDGVIRRSEWPTSFDGLPALFQDELTAAVAAGLDAGVAPRVAARRFWDRLGVSPTLGDWDRNHDGGVDADELLQGGRAFRPFLNPWDALTRYDADHDGRVLPAEYPGAPTPRAHVLGTDALGRDLLTRLAHGAGISLAVALLATLVSVVIGTLWGTTAAVAGGRVDALMMRLVDVLYGLPFVFVAILLVMVFGRNVYNLFLALGAVQWLTLSRVVRAHIRGLLALDVVAASVAMGVPPVRLAATHLVPHAAGPIAVYAALLVPAVVIEEAFLSFLGLGVAPPHASWGTLLTDGLGVLPTHPALALWPAACLTATLLALNTLGQALSRRAMPRSAQEAP